MSEIILSLEALGKTFKTGNEELRILEGVDLELATGKSAVIMGGSGSGKSTLLNLVAGLDWISSGSIRCAGLNIGTLDERGLSSYRRNTLGFVFQFHFLLKEFSALENIMLPALISGSSEKEAAAKASTLLEEVGLTERAGHYPSQLSGGERQRIAVARALINNPALLLADEPTGSLDEHNSRMVEDILFSLVQRRGTTMLLVTHDANLAARGDERFVLAGGTLRQA